MHDLLKHHNSSLSTSGFLVASMLFFGCHQPAPEGSKSWTLITEADTEEVIVRKAAQVQPDAVIAISGPDARWVGNEEGYARTSEWSVVPIAAGKQHGLGRDISTEIDSLFPQNTFSARAKDIGSRRKLLSQDRPYYLVWNPAETDVSIRPSWVYRPEERPRSLDELLDIYYNSIGRNSVLLLNFAPDTRGLIPDEDIERAHELRRVLDATFDENLALDTEILASNEVKGHLGTAAVDGHPETNWTTPDGISGPALELKFGSPRTFNRVVLQEYIQVGQRCEEFVLEARDAGEWKEFSRGTTIGYKRILRTADITTDAIRLVITGSRASPTLGELGLYYQPPPGAIVNR